MTMFSGKAAPSAVRAPLPPVAELLPQSGPMMLLDAVLEAGEHHIICTLTVRDDGLFSTADGRVPAWVGIEYMAQTIAAYSGYHRKRRGEPVDLGFLLGTRYYQCSVPAFPRRARLEVRADKDMDGLNGLSIFACRIQGDNIEATASLNVFLPEDARTFLAAKGL